MQHCVSFLCPGIQHAATAWLCLSDPVALQAFSISPDGASALLQHAGTVLPALLNLLEQHMTQETLAGSHAVHAALQCLAGVSRSSRGAEAALAAEAGRCVVAVVQQVGCWVFSDAACHSCRASSSASGADAACSS